MTREWRWARNTFIAALAALFLVGVFKLDRDVDRAADRADAIIDTQDCLVGLFFTLPEDRRFLSPEEVHVFCPSISTREVRAFIERGVELQETAAEEVSQVP